jgi:hypothetical protein
MLYLALIFSELNQYELMKAQTNESIEQQNECEKCIKYQCDCTECTKWIWDCFKINRGRSLKV